MSQVSPENVLAVGSALAAQVDAMRQALMTTRGVRVDACGQDPISELATPSFQAKFDSIIDAHTRHMEEVDEAVARLRMAAEAYRLSDEEIRATFGVERSPAGG